MNYKEKYYEIRNVLQGVRKILQTPEGKDIIEQAVNIIDELYNCPTEAHFSPCGNHLKTGKKCDWCMEKYKV